MKIKFFFGLAFLLCSSAIALNTKDNAPSGFVQTPIGGGIGTSDYQRPTLQELGIHRILHEEDFFNFNSSPVKGFAGYQKISGKGLTLLKSPLMTYGHQLNTNTKLKSDIKFDWYYSGINYPIHFFKNTIAPQLELALLDFNYQFQTPHVSSGRSYHHALFRIGATLTVPINSEISLLLSIGEGLFPFAPLDISTAGISLVINSQLQKPLQIGASVTKIDFKDKQAMPNHLHLNTGILPVVSY